MAWTPSTLDPLRRVPGRFLMVALTGWLVLCGPATAADVAILTQQARQALAQGDGVAAVRMLEPAVLEAGPQRAEVVQLLRQAYERAIAQLEAAGQKPQAEAYRENLSILGRKPKAAPDKVEARPTPTPAAPAEATPAPAGAIPPQPPAPLAEAPRSSASIPAIPDPASDDPPRPPAPEPAASTVPPNDTDQPSLKDADSAFRAGKYQDAGRLYSKLDSSGALPASRRPHWAYCRCVAVIHRLNAQPRSQADWSELDRETLEIKKLSPSNWFGEYVRNLVVTRAPRGSENARPGATKSPLFRGASPDEPAPAQALPEPAEPHPTTGAVDGIHAEPGVVAPAPAEPNPAPTAWQLTETANFRIHHANPELAERVGAAAEAVREAQAKRWSGEELVPPWTPRCEIVLYPTAVEFSQATGQPPDAPGISTMGLSGGRVVARQVHLQAGNPGLITAILPHEVTHVVLADLFPDQPIPRWADEGIAVLSEPAAEQRKRLTELSQPLGVGRALPLATLLATDTPNAQDWPLFYAQSVALTQYLVVRGGHQRFIAFLREARVSGFDTALTKTYGLRNIAELETSWRSDVQERLARVDAPAPDSAPADLRTAAAPIEAEGVAR